MFAASSFNQDIGLWNVAKGEAFAFMFEGSGFNRPIGGWNLLSAVNLESMFLDNDHFNQPLNAWDVSKVTDFRSMFMNSVFNQNVAAWNLQSAGGPGTGMTNMFSGASIFNQDLCPWGIHTNPAAAVGGLFDATDCPVKADPDLTGSPPGPFCYACP